MLAHRRRRWTNIIPTLAIRLLLLEYDPADTVENVES